MAPWKQARWGDTLADGTPGRRVRSPDRCTGRIADVRGAAAGLVSRVPAFGASVDAVAANDQLVRPVEDG